MFQILQEFDDPRIAYGFFGRKGGVSEGVFSSLNAHLFAGDSETNVIENRRRICNRLDISNVSTLVQIHSANCIVIDKPLSEKIEADALVTITKGVGIGVLTADCGPVLIYGDGMNGPVIGAAHAGWGGTVKGILENTIQKMIEQGARKDTIRAAIGPAIGLESYEVSEEFLKPFQDEDAESIMFFKPGSASKFWFDLPGYIEFRLRRFGISQIHGCGIDTYKQEADYFSFRRATHRGEKEYGRQLSVIAIR